MKFVEELKNKNLVQRDEHFKSYRSLVRRASTGAALSAKDQQALTAAMNALGFDFARLERDAQVMEKAEELKRKAEKLPELKQAEASASDTLRAIGENAQRIIGAETDKVNVARAALKEREQSVKRCEEIRDQLRKLESEHFELMDVADPAIARRRGHIAQVLYGRPKSADLPHDLIEFEILMANPDLPNEFQRVNLIEFVPLAGQTIEQVQDLVAKVNAIGKAGRAQFYLLPEGTDLDPLCHRDLVRTPYRDNSVDLLDLDYQLAPGQTPEQLEQLKRRIIELIPPIEKIRRIWQLGGHPDRNTLEEMLAKRNEVKC